MTDPLHVVFAANRAYVPYVSAAITSVRHNLDPAVALDVTILSRDLSPAEIGWPNRGSADSLRCFSPEVDRSTLPIRPADHLTVETYYRLFLETAFDETVKRVVYLDADLVVLGDLSHLERCLVESRLSFESLNTSRLVDCFTGPSLGDSDLV